MKIFVTGASGFVGSAVVKELVAHGHRVTGLARSEANVQAITAAGAQVHRGSLQDLDGLARAAAESDGVIHTGFIHDFANYAASAQVDKAAIEAMGRALQGSQRPLVVTAGAVRSADRTPSTEDVPASPHSPRLSESTALGLTGVRSIVVRLPPTVHGAGDHGFVPELIRIAKATGVSGFIGDGSNRWPAVHRLDAARAFRLAVEKAPAGTRVHAVAEEGIATKTIATVIGERLGLPVESRPPQHFGWLGSFYSWDAPLSSTKSRALLGWSPTEPGLLDDLRSAAYLG